MPVHPFLEKVTAFITRNAPSGMELLLLQHPTAGIQFPAGTVEEGEPLESAALREVAEETGLTNTRILRLLGCRDELPPTFDHVIFHSTKVYSRPDPTSFDWASLRRGIAVRLERTSGAFAQVTFDEGNRYPDPDFITYCITGWVPLDALAAVNRRFFYHIHADYTSPERWQQFSDNHLFEPFWSPLHQIPEVVGPQRAWLELFLDSLAR